MPRSIIDKLGTQTQIGAIIHLGAGNGLDLPALMATSAARIILIEPDPTTLPTLRNAATDKRCEIISLAVAEEAGQAQLHRFNFAAVSSLKSPLKALKDLFPGLKETATPTVEALPLSAILARAKLDGSKSNMLIIDAPGMESQIVDMALALDPEVRFAHVILRAADTPMYEGSEGFGTLQEKLQAAGYRSKSKLSADPDFPEGWFRLDPLALKVQRLETSLAESEAARIKMEECAKARKQKVEDLEKRIAALNTLLQERLNREDEKRQKMQVEFLRAEAQMQLLREFMDLSAQRDSSLS